MKVNETLLSADASVFLALEFEVQRQRQNLELIASENYTSVAVMKAMGSHLTNKYAEGYPGRRYYGGCVNVDTIEDLARTRAKQLFGADHANVQPHSGAQANMAVYFSMLKPGDTVLGLDLAHGGHLTHGQGIAGNEAEKVLDKAGITVNKNGIPFDPNPPLKPSGIRVGSPAVTTRGMKEAEMGQIAGWIDATLRNRADEAAVAKVREEVFALTDRFPIPE